MSDNLIFNNNKIYIIPTQDKPVKICFDDFTCPLNSQTRCKYSEITYDEESLIVSFICKNNKCEKEL